MGNSIGALLVTLSVSLGQVTTDIGQEEREFQAKAYRQWWGKEIVWKFDELPTEGKVVERRVPYSGYIYPDTAGGTMSALRKYDTAFNGGRLLATAYEQRDTSLTETVTRQVTQRFGLFGRQVRTYTVQVNATPAWYGHCNGWTAAAIRHAEPQKEVTHNGVVFTPADIKGLLAEIYMYNDPQMLAGDGTWINPGVLHAIMANWLGKGGHPIGMEADPGKEKWNYPIYAYSAQTAQYSPQFVDVGMNVTYAQSSRGEFQVSPRIWRTKYFHYRLQLDDDGSIVGGWYYRDSSRIDMLWVPLRPKPGGKEGNERGNPHIDVDEVVAIWRKSVPDDVRRDWVIIDPPNHAPVITAAKSSAIAENQTQVLQVTASDRDLDEGLNFVAPQQLAFSISGGADQAAFEIDAETGELSFRQAADFEQPNDANEDNLYEVKVRVEDGVGESADKLLRIAVTDTNDAPAITSDHSSTSLENQVAVMAVTFEDQDQPTQTLSCSLSGGADRGKFSIDSKTGELTFNTVPDFERPADADGDNLYEVEVSVTDGADGTAKQLVHVTVTNANDAPVIVSNASPQVAEQQSAALTVLAEDEDAPIQPLSYLLSGGADQSRFALDRKTGALTFKQVPDFEKPGDKDKDNRYEVEVEVQDDAGGKVTQRLCIAVTDANDRPVITTDGAPKSAEGQLVALTVAAQDEDTPPQKLAFSLRGGADGEKFTINATTGELTFKQSPDFENPADADKDNVYEVDVKVEDDQGGIATQPIKVAVLDVNEHPTITYSPKVQENQTEVLTVNVADEDMSMQSIRISLSDGADRELFSIDSKTGDLAFKIAPDFEKPSDADKDNIYEVVIRVEDGQGGLAVQSLRVKVTDADETPVEATPPESQSNSLEVEPEVEEPAAQPK